MSWWLLIPLLYGIGGFISLVAFMVVIKCDGKRFDITDSSDKETAMMVFITWPFIALLLLAFGASHGVVYGAKATADWLNKDAAK